MRSPMHSRIFAMHTPPPLLSSAVARRCSLLPAALLLTVAACAPAARHQVINPPGIAPLVPAYSVAVRAGELVFVSGMTGIKPGTQDIVDGGVAIQTRQTLENIRTSLESAGATMADVVECTVFLKDMADYAAMNAVYVEFFKVNPPARATLAVTALPRPAARVEIKCSAVRGKR
jgi:2-iminobutanoate/2-iminopropanoate deaminase